MSTPHFRTFPLGFRVVMGGLLAPRGWPLERWDGAHWVYVDTLPPGVENARQYAASVGGTVTVVGD